MREWIIMRKRFHKRAGGFIRSKGLTRPPKILYDVIAVNGKTGEIRVVGKVESVEEAKQVISNKVIAGFKFYLLENNTVLTELV